MRRAASSSASMTMVMRETPPRAVRPTVERLDVVAATPEQRRDAVEDAGQVFDVGDERPQTTLGHDWSPWFGRAARWFIRRRRLDERTGPADHVVEVRAGRDHRVDAVFLLDAEIDDDGARRGARARDGAFDLFALGDAQAGQAVRLGELHEVGAAQRRRGVAAVVEELLPLPDHAEVAVVDDGDVDLDALLRDGGELARGHLEAAVADDDPDLLVRQAKRAPMAAGSAKPIVPSPPDVMSFRGWSCL